MENEKASKKGLYNSSITRVRPYFKLLFQKDSTGKSWLPKLLRGVSENCYAQKLANVDCGIMPLGVVKRTYSDKILGQIQLENCFEYALPPSKEFLKWLIEHPHQLTWPANGNMVYGDDAQMNRENLMSKHGPEKQIETIRKALHLLETSNLEKESRLWWMFEGFTELDCYLETSDFCLAIEGKRTETISSSTSWYPQRNQIIRNLESLQAKAGSKQFALLLMSQDGVESVSESEVELSLPHYTQTQRTELMSHYLGSVSWQSACQATGLDYEQLPNTKHDAIESKLI